MKAYIKFLLATIVVLLSFNQVNASELPKPIINKLSKTFNKMVVRFDSLIELQDGTQYLPVYPSVYKDVENPADIKFTIPENTDLKKLPDMVQFENNLALFKIIRKAGKRPTLTHSNKVPIEVKLGLLPQDLLVPEYLTIPMELRIILGDLIVPINEEIDEFKYLDNIDGRDDYKVRQALYKKDRLITDKSLKYKDLFEKSFYVVNYKSSSIFNVDPEVGRPKKEIKLSSLPFDIKTTWDNRYLLALSITEDKLNIIDTVNNSVIREIKVGKNPTSIAVAPPHFKAYVANSDSSSISVIDLKKMENEPEIKVQGKPTKLYITNNFKTLVYIDSITNTVFKVRLDIDRELYAAQEICQAKNLSKVIYQDNLYYLLSRTDNRLKIYDPTKKAFIQDIEVGDKPVDITIIKDKIYVLSAGTDELLIFKKSNYDLLKVVKLNSGGFAKKINLISNKRKAIISSIGSSELILYNLNSDKVEHRIPISIPVNSMVITRDLQ